MDGLDNFWQGAIRLSLLVGSVLLALTFIAGICTLLLRSRASRLFLAVAVVGLALAAAVLVLALAMRGPSPP